MIAFAIIESPNTSSNWEKLILVVMIIQNSQNIPDFSKEEAISSSKNTCIEICVTWLNKYFNGFRTNNYDVSIVITGTDFQKKIYELLLQISYGKTMYYSNIAKMISPTMSSQAVGHAISLNPISLIIPCHRVIGKNGNLTDYAGGIENKEYLLRLEKAII